MHQHRFHSRPGQAPLRTGQAPLVIGFVSGLCAATLAISSCGGGSPANGPGTGGENGGAAGGGRGGTNPTGTTGAGGATGNAGATGTAGSTGPAGASGTAGTAGAAGAAGAAGSAGATGAAGSAGATGAAGSAGATGTAGRGGTTGTGGAMGAAGTTGTAGRGGTTGTAGGTGTAGRGGTTGTAGTTGSAGSSGRGGTTGTAGTTGTGGTSTPACSVAAGPRCSGAMAQNPNPFGCTFAWGRQSPSGSGTLSGYNYLQMVANWVETGIRSDGSFSSCSGCTWLTSRVAGTNLIPVYYAYMIGFYGHMNGLPDMNSNGGSASTCGPSGTAKCDLTTGGAALIRAHRQTIIDIYTKYAQQTHTAWPTKPLVWFLEGDFIQYTEASQANPLTMAELGQLAADITCAIKSNMPNAVVAINHTTWNADTETNSFWCEMGRADYDMVWTTGVGNNGNFIESAGAAGYYNAATATYPYLHSLTGRTIAVDTSYGASGMPDSWSSQSAQTLNNHIMNGVIGVNISTNPPSNYQTIIQNIGTLGTTCR